MDEKIMEIVAPAGNMESLKASVNAGAKAVYLGLKGFGARRKAGNFTVDELVEAIDYAHIRGVRTYLTLNTILKDNEIKAVYTNLKKLYNEGLDALIVQDFGVYRFVKENFPEMEIHGSTQMTVSNHLEAEYLKKLGFKRVVVSRELSYKEIKSIKEKTDIELEVFVSGALCISYSGRCYFSSILGGRSGNRGLCAQPCRRTYEKDAKKGYYLSPKDQIFSEKEISKLEEIGVESIKVEGRMKSPAYVYETVKYFNNILKQEKEKRYPERLFNRAYSKGYFYGKDKELINRDYSFDFGVKIGDINGKTVKLYEYIRTGDGVSFVSSDKKVIEGTYINKIIKDKKVVKEAYKNDIVSIGVLPKGARELYRTYDKVLNDKVEKDLKEAVKTPIKGKLTLNFNQNIVLEIENEVLKIEIEGKIPEEARNPMNGEKLKEKISEIGDTNFYFDNIDIVYDNRAFISFKELKEMKRDAVRKFEEKLVKYYKRDLQKEYSDYIKHDLKKEFYFEIAVKLRDKTHYELIKSLGIEKIYLDSQEIIREENLKNESIEKGDLIKNISHLEDKSKKTLDTSFNIFNQRAFDHFEEDENIDVIYLSSECSLEQIGDIKSKRAKKGVLVYGMPKLMHIEHEIFSKEYEELVNEYGDKLIVVKNEYGNSEVYLNDAFNIIDRIDDLIEQGVEEIRLDFTFESEYEIKRIIEELKTKKSYYKPYNFEKGVL